MQKIIFFIFFGISFLDHAQNVSVEQSIYGIQTGILGIWVHNESRLADQIALRSEVGFDAGLWGGSFYDKTGYAATPVLTLSPRWYYNLKRRAEKSKRTNGNSANFLALKTSFRPDWFVISNYDNVSYVSDFSIVPTWGIRRNIGAHFNYEAGLGVGYIYYFAKAAGYDENESAGVVNLHLRIGYRF
ncbi:hypothetical protein [Flavimarina sp. Hel_I_48]|uniref:hypothetical protein n=1 Tax=Flavimarina sp. Hel_I_48 TaxID=1392488 RepID=UPI0004DFBEA0|nr:hypothetical protein [Flavimarina sp. Hel_I_48]